MSVLDKVKQQLTKMKTAQHMTQMRLPRKSISDIAGLEQFLQLAVLDFSHNNIRDLEPLSHLTKLAKLDISFNRVEKLHPLYCCSSLTSLSLEHNLVSDVGQLRYIQPLAKLSKLTLNDNALVSDPQFRGYALLNLYHIGHLQFQTDGNDKALLWECDLESGKQKVKEMFTKDKDTETKAIRISKLSDRVCCKNFEYFTVFGQLKEFSVQAYDGDFKGFDLLLEMPQLERVRCSSLKQLPTYQKQFKIKELNLNECKLENLEVLEMFPMLRKLSICDNKLASLRGIEQCPHLTELQAYSNQLTSLDGVQCCRKLERIDVQQNQLRDISQLDGFGSLTLCDIGNNQIYSIAPLGQSLALKELYVYGNKLSNSDELEILLKMKSLKYINVEECPLVEDAKMEFVNEFVAENLRISEQDEKSKLRNRRNIGKSPFERADKREAASNAKSRNAELRFQRYWALWWLDVKALRIAGVLKEFQEATSEINEPNIFEIGAQ